MMKSTFLFLLFFISILGLIANTQERDTSSIESLFLEQIALYPQEKIHMQTDRNVYMSGETLWFRVHLVDALLLKQANASRYVYVEFINPVENLVQRVKIRPDSTGCFYGHVYLDEDLEEGNYSLRAYTQFMQNQGEDYFFSKPIYITDPASESISPIINFFADGDNIRAEIQFIHKTDSIKILPEECKIFPDGDKNSIGTSLSFKNETAHYTFRTKRTKPSKAFLLQTIINGRIYNRYFNLPDMEKTFDVTFFPEGGYAPFSTDIRMAFKSINQNGLSEEIKGQVFDDQGGEYAEFESSHLGMGAFRMYYVPGKKYHIICTNNAGISKRFDLPTAQQNAISLKTQWINNYLRVSLSKAPDTELQEQTQLIAHIRGAVIYSDLWDDKQDVITFERDFFPAGIIHFLLIDKDRNILSERLVFSTQSSTLGQASVMLNQQSYSPRNKIELKIKLTDENKVPLTGNFSLAVVDKSDMEIDTTSTIVSTLLLSSELKGHIESPMSYLQKNNRKIEFALDILMQTQGWRRYDIPNILKGNLTRELTHSVELSEEVSGKSEGIFTALKEGEISLLAMRDSVIGVSLTKPDEKGRFIFKDLEYPERTYYIIQAINNKGTHNRLFLQVDSPKTFPFIKLPPLNQKNEKQLKTSYITKMNEKYTVENGIRIYDLAEIVVTAKRKVKLKTESPYYSPASSAVLTAEDIEKSNFNSVYDLLRRIPGVTVLGNEIRFRGGLPMAILDNVPEENFDYERVNVNDIKDIFISPAASVAPIYGSRAAGGAVIINTKTGFVERNILNTNIQIINSLGYQQKMEFYSPVYTTDQGMASTTPDLRTTIYWNPNVQTDESGTATVSFYSADTPTQYGIVLEGISTEGHIIHSAEKEISIKY